MKVTLEPETDAEKEATETVTYSGLRTVGIVGAYEDLPPHKPMIYAHWGLDGYEMMALLPILNHKASEFQRKIDAARAYLAETVVDGN